MSNSGDTLYGYALEHTLMRKKERRLYKVERIHERKKFPCVECKKEFAQKHVLTSHLSAVHEGKKPYVCKVCNAAFGYKSKLNYHMNAIHDGKKKCGICATKCASA